MTCKTRQKMLKKQSVGEMNRLVKPSKTRLPLVSRSLGLAQVVADHTAGDPMDEQIRWTNLSRQAIADQLAERHGIRVSVTVIKQLMKAHHYRLRKAQKKSP